MRRGDRLGARGGELDELLLDRVDASGDLGRVEGRVLGFEPGPGVVIEGPGGEEALIGGGTATSKFYETRDNLPLVS